MEPGQGGPLQTGSKYLAQKTIIPRVKDHYLVVVQHVVVWVRGVVIHVKRRYRNAARRLITQDVLIQRGRQHVLRPQTAIKKTKCGAGGAPTVGYMNGSGGATPPCHTGIFSGTSFEYRLSLLNSLRIRWRMPLTDRLERRRGLFLDSTSALF